jgi:hypothetical protein
MNILPSIAHDHSINRKYIPIGAGWEIQTKGEGSTFRISDGERQYAFSGLYDEEVLTRMALDLREFIQQVALDEYKRGEADGYADCSSSIFAANLEP